jgi:hypothetical protein
MAGNRDPRLESLRTALIKRRLADRTGAVAVKQLAAELVLWEIL